MSFPRRQLSSRVLTDERKRWNRMSFDDRETVWRLTEEASRGNSTRFSTHPSFSKPNGRFGVACPISGLIWENVVLAKSEINVLSLRCATDNKNRLPALDLNQGTHDVTMRGAQQTHFRWRPNKFRWWSQTAKRRIIVGPLVLYPGVICLRKRLSQDPEMA